MPVSRNAGGNHRKTDNMNTDLDIRLRAIEASTWMVIGSATDYPPGWCIQSHSHSKHQLIYAIQGVMVVRSSTSQWTVPPSRGIWMPSGHEHAIRCVGAVEMRNVFVHPDASLDMPGEPGAVSVSPLLRELIRAAVTITEPFSADSRAARVMSLILDELKVLPTLPLHLPQPADTRIQEICTALQHNPGDGSTLADWAVRLGVDEKTIQRLFRKGTGMTFGQWRQQARLLLALERIAVGCKIIDVAGELGYESPSAFTTMFKKQFGMTPSHFFK